MDNIVRAEAEIEEQLNWAQQGVDKGSHYSGQSYEEGMLAMWFWLIGDIDDCPDGEE